MPNTVAARKTANIRATLALAVRQQRAGKDLTQEDVARDAGTSAATIGEIEAEKGNPRIDTIDRIAAVLGLEVVVRSQSAA